VSVEKARTKSIRKRRELSLAFVEGKREPLIEENKDDTPIKAYNRRKQTLEKKRHAPQTSASIRRDEQKRFDPARFVCDPSQRAVWERIDTFLNHPHKKTLILEAPKGGGKSWLLLMLHTLATQGFGGISPVLDQGRCSDKNIHKIWRDLATTLEKHEPRHQILFIAGERWEPPLRPVSEPFVLPQGPTLTEQEVRNQIAATVKKVWALPGVPLPQSPDSQATFEHALRRRLNAVRAPQFILLLVDTPEALTDDARAALEALVLRPYLDAPQGKVLLTLRVGAYPIWEHLALREAERYLLPGIPLTATSTEDQEARISVDLIQRWCPEQQREPCRAALNVLLERWRACSPQVRQDETATTSSDMWGLPPLLLSLAHDACLEAFQRNPTQGWSCLRDTWLRHTFRFYREQDVLRLPARATFETPVELPWSQWEHLLQGLVTSYLQKGVAFDLWDWTSSVSLGDGVDPWRVVGFLQHEGLMRFHRGHWWLDPSLCALFASPGEARSLFVPT